MVRIGEAYAGGDWTYLVTNVSSTIIHVHAVNRSTYDEISLYRISYEQFISELEHGNLRKLA